MTAVPAAKEQPEGFPPNERECHIKSFRKCGMNYGSDMIKRLKENAAHLRENPLKDEEICVESGKK
jgi:hypothetical protein